MGLAFAVAGIYQAQALNPYQENPKTAQKQATTDNHYLPHPPPPFFSQVFPTKKTQAEAAHDANKREEKATNDRWTLRIAEITTAILALQLVIFGLQARRLRQTIVKMDEIERRNAVDVRESIAASVRAAEAAELNARAFLGMEGPILVVEEVAISHQPSNDGSAVRPVVEIRNYGRTPAFVAEVIVNISITATMEIMPSYQRTWANPDGFIIEKDGKYTYTEFRLNNLPDFSSKAVERHISAEKRTFIYGIIFYRDFLNERFERGFVRVVRKRDARSSYYGDVYKEYDFQRPEMTKPKPFDMTWYMQNPDERADEPE